jgi:hypothetical protein
MMDGEVLGAALQAAVDAKLTTSIGQPYTDMPQEFKDKFIYPIAEAIAEQVVLHIQTAGVVNTVVTGTLTPPSAVAGTGVGSVS